MPVVLDTSALLAALQDEPGKQIVDAAPCYLSTVNLAEFATKCLAGGMSHADLRIVLDGFNLSLIDFNAALALGTGELRAATRHLGLSLGDRACLALARQMNANVLTADRPWLQLGPALGFQIECIRPETH